MPVAEGSFSFPLAQIRDAPLRRYARRLFGELDFFTDELLPYKDYALYLEIEQGSVNGWGKVAVSAYAVYLAIGAYGDFRQGVRQLEEDGKKVMESIAGVASENLQVPKEKISSKRFDGGNLTELRKLFDKVERRELSAEEATRMGVKLFEEDGKLPKGLQKSLSEAVESVQLNPRQLELAGLPEVTADPLNRQRGPRRSRDPILDSRNRLRIELRREHKNGRVVVKVITL